MNPLIGILMKTGARRQTLDVGKYSPTQMSYRKTAEEYTPSCPLVVFEAMLFVPLPVLALQLLPSVGPETW